eukprot:1491292-Prorocentrum_lima.AAC.1
MSCLLAQAGARARDTTYSSILLLHTVLPIWCYDWTRSPKDTNDWSISKPLPDLVPASRSPAMYLILYLKLCT